MEELLNRQIKELIDAYPGIGEVLDEYGIGCVPCSVGTCLLKDIVDIHNLEPGQEQEMMTRVVRIVFPDRDIRLPLRAQKAAAAEPAYSPPMRKLVDEHKFILRWAALIPAVAESADVTTEEGRRTILEGVEFIRGYADKYHHAKEEDILFKYFDPETDIVKVMLADHETARAHVRAIVAAVEQRDQPAVREHLLAYGELLKEHIKKEDEILYPWMDRQLTDTQIGTMFSRFGEVDRQFGDTPSRMERWVEDLEAALAEAAGRTARKSGR